MDSIVVCAVKLTMVSSVKRIEIGAVVGSAKVISTAVPSIHPTLVLIVYERGKRMSHMSE